MYYLFILSIAQLIKNTYLCVVLDGSKGDSEKGNPKENDTYFFRHIEFS